MHTGPDYIARHTLPSGLQVVVRHIRPEDADELREGFLRLSPTSRYRRFFGGTFDLSPETLRYLTCVDGETHVALVAIAESPDLKTERGVGVARFVRLEDDPGVAEAAITVVDDMQGQGIGTLLARALAQAARERRVGHFRAEVLQSNVPVRRMLAEAGARVLEDGPESVVFDVALDGEGRAEGPDSALLRILRAAATQIAGLIRSLGPPGAPWSTRPPRSAPPPSGST